ncbi:DUF4435 domain-containing protein [Clostridium butyricum]
MENSLLDYMDESTGEIEDIFQEFVETRRNEKDSIVYGFFEGNDDYSYYGFRIKKYSDKEILEYECNGKENVLNLYSMIKSNTKAFDENELLFFVDKDFEINNIKSKDIYVTPVYSIENFYMTDSAFNEFLKGELHINNYSKGNKKIDYDKVTKYYKGERSKFIKKVGLLNIWYSLQKNKSKGLEEGIEPDLSKLKSVYGKYLRNDIINGQITIERLKELTNRYIDVTEFEIKGEEIRLCSNPLVNFRGKYFEEFLYKTLNFIIEDANKPINKPDKPKLLFSEKRKVNLPIGKDNLISLLSQYADTPNCLDEYLKRTLFSGNDSTNEISS